MTVPRPRASVARLIAEQRSHQPDVVRLAQLLSLAAQAEAYFVREARLRFLPHSSTGLEARLWFSPLVEAADGRTLVLDAGVASALRGELTGDRALLASVRDFTERAHRDAPLAVRVFESLLWAATSGDAPQEEGVRRALAPFLSRVLAGGAEALEASRWALRFLPRLPAAVRDLPPARRLRITAAERLGLELEPAGGAAAREARAVRRLVHGDVDVGVRAVPGGIVLTRPPERDALVCQVSGAARVRLRLRAALPGAAWHDLDLLGRRRADVTLDVLATARLDGTLEAARAEPGDVLRCAWSGERGAVAVTADRRTTLRFDAPDRVVSAELPAAPELLAVADAGAPRAAAVAGTALSVVGAALDGSGEVATHAWAPRAAAIGWAADAVLCVAEGRHVHLLADGDPARLLRRLTHDAAVLRMWTAAALDAVAVADADGRVVLHRGTAAPRTLCGPGPHVTALTGHHETGAVAWSTADGRVHVLASPAAPAPVVSGRTTPPPTALALLADTTVVAADATPCLHRFPPPPDASDGGEVHTDQAGGGSSAMRAGFAVREVYAGAGGDRLVLVGGGAPVEIRAEDGRTHVVLPASAAQADGPAGPAWVRASVGVVLPGAARAAGTTGEAGSAGAAGSDGPTAPAGAVGPADTGTADTGTADLPDPADAAWLQAARRSGIGHVCVGGPLLDDAPALAAFTERARDAGLRVLADLRAPDDPELLLTAQRLLDAGLDGLRVGPAIAGPEATAGPAAAGAETVTEALADLWHLVDAYPDAALIAVGAPAGTAHVTPVPPPDPSDGADSLAPGARWALPDGCPPIDARRLLALPGCCAVPYALLTADGPQRAGHAELRALLAVRARQLALVHGESAPVSPAPPAGVSALWRRYAGQSVLCLTNATGAAVTVPVEAGAGEHELVDLTPYAPTSAPGSVPGPAPESTPERDPAGPTGPAHAAAAARSASAPGAQPPAGDIVDATQPLVVRAAEGHFAVTVGAGRTRWLSVWDAGGGAGRRPS